MDGLVNGACGTVVDLIGVDGTCECVVVNVPRYSGPPLCAPFPSTWIPIPRSVAQWFSVGLTRERKQFPSTLAYAITIHKSPGLTYVAFSRHSVGINIFHPGYANSRLEQNFLAPSFKQRMREEVRLRSLERL